tara:strand:- start:728 stop:1069 length:342 start_codon:yes stop_codon:yes gene_type:complete
MNRLFSDRHLPFDQNDKTPSRLYFEHLYTHAGVDMPELIPEDSPGHIVLESREALLARLASEQHTQRNPVQDGTAAYHEMMARIESSALSPALAAEFDDYMNPEVTVQNSNNT